MRKVLAVLLFCCCWSGTAAWADLSLEFGGYHWWQRYDGRLDLRNVPLDFRDDLNLKSAGNNVWFVDFQHPIPLLPNILVQYSDISVSGTRSLGHDVVIDNVRYSGSANVHSEINLSNWDATLYWKIIDTFAHTRLGLTGRVFNHRWAGLDGVALAVASDAGGNKLLARDLGKRARVDLNGTLPMLYFSQMFDLPWTGLSVGLDANGVIWRSSHLYDGRIRAVYQHHSGLGTEFGYRRFDLKYYDSNNDSKLVVDGLYLALTYHL